MSESKNDVTELRRVLFDAIQSVKAGDLTIEKARTINELAKSLIDTAKVDVAYIEATGGKSESPFLEKREEAPALPPGIRSITTHTMR